MTIARSAAAPRARERVEASLAAIEANNARVNAMVLVDADAARAAAARIDAAAAAGEPVGPLAGLVVTLKDNIAVAGQRTTSGARFFADHRPAENAAVVDRLLSADAIILGKVNMQEFAFGATTQNLLLGSCRNPWDTERIPGGSSGGSGAAIAAGHCEASLGSDTGGSGRMPAAVNGCLGLRPTQGRISNHGVFPVSPRFDTISPMAREAGDVAALLDALTGFDARDPWSVAGKGEAGPARFRIGVPRAFFFEDIDPEIAALVEAAIAVFAAAGVAIVPIDLPDAARTQGWMSTLLLADAAETHQGRIAEAPELFDPEVLRRLRLGFDITGIAYAEALTAKAAWQRTLRATFETVDLILTPTLAKTAPLIADSKALFETTQALTRFAFAWALGGGPALSVPCGFASNGTPVAFQLAAAPWHDELAIRAADLYQRATDWHRARPTIAPAEDCE
ncbi:amidase [Acuticoccus kandeliae]|uniref:amidase n=1 Tax=Acuticoccus kandeliae TaxID=2073160 RepID=UPI000D3E752F|nr:amidase [Acuticoccus kandeliae]